MRISYLQMAIYENGELTENSEDDVIAMIRWQGNFYYLREQNNTAFLEIPSGMQITLEKDSRGYDPNHIRTQFIFSEKAQYLRYGYQLYLLNGETATLVEPDIRWVGGGTIDDTFDDLLMVDGQLYANTAREYCNAEQPARFDTGKTAFTYRNENDDDTFHASFSYDRYEDAFLILTFQISEQRTHRVAAETHITPKTISWLSKDFQTVTPVFFTEDFEINLTRRLDKNHILMTTEPFMTGKRTLKMLDIETQEVTDVDIPGLLQVYLFYPARDENTIFLIGQNTLPSWQLYRYELDTQTLTQVEFPETPRQIVDLQLTYQPGAED